ncbi:MAG: hypothetical protein ABJC60_03240, partial [Actinomycetota bacterium]
MSRARHLLWPAGILLGLAAEKTLYGWGDPLHWIPDLAVGWTFIGFGLAATTRWPDDRTGRLMAVTGFTWLLGNFTGVDSAALAWVATHAIFVYRGPLVHLVLAYPSGRLPGRVERSAAAAGYAAAFIPPVWRNDAT